MPVLTNTFSLITRCLFLLLLIGLFPDRTFAISLGIDTRGYVFGQLSRINRIGTSNRSINGEILLGYESSTGSNRGQQNTKIISNQWHFCFDKKHYDTLISLVGNYVALKYKTPKKSSLLTCSAPNELLEIYSALKYDPLGAMQFESNELIQSGEISSGVEFGRITNAIKNKQQSRYFFLTMQIGNNGNKFRDFITVDPDLFDFAVESLRMGIKVRVHYIERLPRISHRGGALLHIWKMEIINQESSITR